VTRRTALLGALGAVGLSAAAVGVGLAFEHRASAGTRDQYPWTEVESAAPQRADPGRSVSGSFVSAERHGVRTGWTIGYPPGHFRDALPVMIVLHATNGTHNSAFAELYLNRYLADVVALGTAPFAIASVDGGFKQYWHPRRAGDPAGMVINEFIPLLADHGLQTDRVGLFGWSMGGYGALYLATVLGAARVAAVVAESPAIWTTYAAGVPGAFDDEDDYVDHSIFRREKLLKGIPLRIDCGASDSFAPATRELRAQLVPTPAGGISPGHHNPVYWRAQAPAELEFIGRWLGRTDGPASAVTSSTDTSG
jgi:hypothetical protein